MSAWRLETRARLRWPGSRPVRIQTRRWGRRSTKAIIRCTLSAIPPVTSVLSAPCQERRDLGIARRRDLWDHAVLVI